MLKWRLFKWNLSISYSTQNRMVPFERALQTLEEQLILLKREMVMGIRSFLKHREIWAWKAVQPSTTPGMQGYARARAEWFQDLAVTMYNSCRQSLEVSSILH